MNESPILRLAIPSPLRRHFDYLAPAGLNTDKLRPGMRLRVPFGRGKKIGLLLSVEKHSPLPRHKLKPIIELIDQEPLFDNELLNWLCWVNEYYHHALGDTVFSALPTRLRQGKPVRAKPAPCWRLTSLGAACDPQSLRKAPKQAALLRLLAQYPNGANASEIRQHMANWRTPMQALQRKRWVECVPASPSPSTTANDALRPKLNADQQRAATAIIAKLGRYHGFLLDGITGSGKTEVYLASIEQVLRNGQQALVLLPEIGLTPQLVARFEQRLGQSVALLHSGLNDGERLAAWLAARDGQARIVIGTRSAVFTPFAKLGLIIVDEEHDLSFKQQEGLRYHARDIAVVRAHRLGIPIVLGSATPSLESLANAASGRFVHLRLPHRAGSATPPRIKRLDLKGQPLLENMAEPLLQQAHHHLERGEQVLFFLNRRGFAPTLICHQCGWVAECHRCDSHMTLHQSAGRLRCHHCASERAIALQCPQCGNPDIRPQGYGTERIEQALQQRFPEHAVIRIDRDTTRRKGKLEHLLAKARQGKGQILLGTQMLAKGHDFPNVTLAAILDADQGLFGTDFRATERLAQLIVQVAGRAGRGDKPGQVIIQTHHPDHPLLETLIEHGYGAFAQATLEERHLAGLPPYRHAALFRAEATQAERPLALLQTLADFCHQQYPRLDCLGPAPSPMERRAGRYRAQLLLLTQRRQSLHRAIQQLIMRLEGDKLARRVRWSVDIDPQDLS